MFKVVNGTRVEMTTEEIAARQAEEQAWLDGPPEPLPVDPLFEALDLIVAALNPAQQAAIVAKLREARSRHGVA